MKHFSVIFLISLVLLCNFALNAQVLSTDKNNPTALKSNIISGKPTSTEATYYYSFFAGPGAFEVTMQGKANRNSSIVEATLFDANKKQIGLIQITPDSGGQVKSISRNLSEKQKITLRLELDPVSADNVTYQIALEGAVSFSESGGTPATPIKIPGRKDDTSPKQPTVKIPGKKDDTSKPPLKIPISIDGNTLKIPGKSKTPDQPQENKSASLSSVFSLTSEQSFNSTASLEFYSPGLFSPKDKVMRFTPSKSDAKISLSFKAQPGTYYIYLDVKKNNGSGNGSNRLEVINTITAESLFSTEFKKTSAQERLLVIVEVTTPTTVLYIKAPTMDWNFYGVEVARLN